MDLVDEAGLAEPHGDGVLAGLEQRCQCGGVTYTTRYVIDTDIPCDPFIIYSTPPTSRIEKARLRVKFSTPPIPTTAWWRENRTKNQAETDPPGEPLIIDENGSMQHTFINLTPGLCQIVAWEWPDE